MRKVILLAIFTALISLAFSSIAAAGGWWKETSTDTVGSLVWNVIVENAGVDSPHSGYSSSTNLCKTCHAVHIAGDNSYRLLKSGNTTETRGPGELQGQLGMGNKRSTECMYCHDANSGASSLRPYGFLMAEGLTVRGEHSLGATIIPDSSVNDLLTPDDYWGNLPNRNPVANGGNGAELDCYQCHSVHGANIITGWVPWGYPQSGLVIDISRNILRNDPAGNGGDVGAGVTSIAAPPGGWVGGSAKPGVEALTSAEIQAAFCGDCHNLNVNFTTTGGVNNDLRPNPRSHPINANGKEEVYGTADTTVTRVVFGVPINVRTCSSCHGNWLNGITYRAWPHQSEGHKLLKDPTDGPYATAGASKNGPGDSDRALPSMDLICLGCHDGPNGVGIGF